MTKTIFNHTHTMVWKLLPFFTFFAFFTLIGFGAEAFTDLKVYMFAFSITTVMFLIFTFYEKKITLPFPIIKNLINNPKLTIYSILIIGFTIRVIWCLIFPTTFTSDSQAYVSLANQLIAEGKFSSGDYFAYWPPGYPLFLFGAHLGVFNVSWWSVIIVNLALYICSTIYIYSIAKRIHGVVAAKLAAVILAIMPSVFSLSGLASKELLLSTLLLQAVFIYSNPSTRSFVFRYLLIGITLGCCVLIQPGTILFFSVFLVTDWAHKVRTTGLMSRYTVLIFGGLLIISPWTLRNYEVFDEFVLVSTNGGSVLYRANNELATGGYMKHGKTKISHLSELEQNKLGNKLGKEWIINNPVGFMKLGFRKLNLFLGDDSLGFYSSLKRSAVEPITGWPYMAAKLFSNVCWLLLWVFIFIGMKKLKRLLIHNKILTATGLSFLYFLSVHVIAESNGKYHLPVIWVIIILASVAMMTVSDKQDRALD